jgi:hypothetical protein
MNLYPISAGHRGILIWAAFQKYCIKAIRPGPAEHLKMLEQLNAMADEVVNAEAIAVIEPFDGEAAEMVIDAWNLPPRQPWMKTSAGWDILQNDPTWSRLVTLNPSLDRAMQLCRYSRKPATAA